MIVKFKKLSENAKKPLRSTDGSVGYDLFSTENKTIKPGETTTIGTGIAIDMKLHKGRLEKTSFYMAIVPRSGKSLKTKIRLSNSPGTIDPDYRGEIKVIIDNIGQTDINIEEGERIAQAIFLPVFLPNFIEVDSLDDTDRGPGGFGSTGK